MHRFQNNNKLLKFQLLRLNEQCHFHGILRQKSWFEIDRAAIQREFNSSYGSTLPAARNSLQIKVP